MKQIIPFAAFAIALAIALGGPVAIADPKGAGADGPTPEAADFPPLSPAGEATAPDDGAFVSACMGAFDQIRALGDVEPGAHGLTFNPVWGVVFRADFTINKQTDPGLINRLICWRQANGHVGTTYAIGQAVAPLAAR